MTDTFSSHPIKVLILEDELAVSQRLQATLENYGNYHTTVVRNYDDAFDTMQRDVPHIVICSLGIGKTDELSAASDIHKIACLKVPIIFLSALPLRQIKQRTLKVKPASYLVKSWETISNGYLWDVAIQLAILKRRSKKGKMAKNRRRGQTQGQQVYQWIQIKNIRNWGSENILTQMVYNN